jgi:DNA polymerase I-like protein with 3'-5' exonuclease and polymerase domains
MTDTERRIWRHFRFFDLARRYIRPATTRTQGRRLAFDIEGDGLLNEATTVYCIAAGDLDSERIDEFGPEQIEHGLDRLAEARYLVGHNIVGFDLRLLHRLHGWVPSQGCVIVDTLITGRLVLPDILALDKQATRMGDPSLGKLIGRHSLEAWGARFGIPKVGAGIEDWSKWTPEIQERCVGDALLCKELYQFLQPDGQPQAAIDLEHRVAPICGEITAAGMPFDVGRAKERQAQWKKRRDELEADLRAQFPEVKNWNSRQQIAALLESRGWVPDRYTPKSKQPVIDDELLETLPQQFPELAGLAENFTLNRRLGQLADGDEAWLRHVGPDGRIHGGIIHIGTPHSRAAHSKPNIAQVPNPKKGKPFATECRELFRIPNDDWAFVSCDQAGLQDRGFAHCLAEFDGGAYARTFNDSSFDTHWVTVQALNLVPPETLRDKGSKIHTALREGAKSFRYGFLFGAQDQRAGIIVRSAIKMATVIDPNIGLMQKIFGTAANPDKAALTRVGNLARNKFMDATPGLRELRASLEAQGRKGFLPGLDGRRVPVRALHTVLNYAVTSAEAVICKRWLVQVRDELGRRFKYGWDGDVVLIAWVHDELVACSRPKIADEVGTIMVHWAKEAGQYYGFKVPLDAEYKVGQSWAGDAASEKPVEAEIATELPSTTLESPPSLEPPKVHGDGKIHCPFHDDSTPSLQLYSDGHYYCFGCDRYGWIHEDLDINDAGLAKLAASECDDTRTLERALQVWDDGKPIARTLAERYLVGIRKLDLVALGSGIDAVLRFHPRCLFGPGERHPCLLALYRDVEDDRPAGIIRIGLTPEGGKIARYTLGRWPGARAIKLWSITVGATMLSIGEGIETVLGAIRCGAVVPPAWAMGPKNGIASFSVIPGIATLGILIDNDGKAVVGAEACATRWVAAGRTVDMLQTVRCKDFNDLQVQR